MVKEHDITNFISFKCTHIAFFVCWFGLLLAGTTIIGYGASNYALVQDYCASTEKFCTYDITLDADKEIFMYLKLSPFYQNNRMYSIEHSGI